MTQSVQEINTFIIPESNYSILEAKINKLNKKALKLHCEPITLNILESFEKIPTSNNDELNDYYNRNNITTLHHKVTLSGIAPVIQGWELIASCETKENGTLIKTIPGKVYPPEYRELLICEHCNSDRRRKYTFIVKNIHTNEFKMVGKSCLKDFLGHVDPNFYAQYLEIINVSDQSEFDGIPTGALSFDIQRYCNIVAAVIREKGFTSKAKASEQEGVLPTSDIAEKIITDIVGKYTIDITDGDKEITEKALTWIKNMPEYNLNDYMYSIHLLAQEKSIKPKDFGFVASIIPAYLRTIEKEIIAEKKATQQKEKSISNYIGTPGEKIQLELTYISSASYEFQISAWNSTTNWIHKFLDNNGNIFIWKTAKHIGEFVNGKNWLDRTAIDINSGHNLKLKGTIKDHSEFRGEKQTVLTRCKIS